MRLRILSIAGYRQDQPFRDGPYICSGGRSALSGKTLRDLGYGSVYNIGGFKELAEAGVEIEKP